MTEPAVRIRTAGPDDVGFIVDTWRNSYLLLCRKTKDGHLWSFDQDIYFRLMQRHIQGLLREPASTALVACDPSDEDTLVGFALLTGPELHYVYVRDTFRKMGIARMLLDGHDVKTFAFKTRVGMGRLKPEARGWTYAPRTAVWADGKVRVEMA